MATHMSGAPFGFGQLRYAGAYRPHHPIGLILPWTSWQAPVPIMPMPHVQVLGLGSVQPP